MRRRFVRVVAPLALVSTLLSGCTFVNFFGSDLGLIMAASILTESPILAGTTSPIFFLLLPYLFELNGTFKLFCRMQPPGGEPLPDRMRFIFEAEDTDTGETVFRKRRTLSVNEQGECRSRSLRLHEVFDPNTELRTSIRPLGADVGVNWTFEFQIEFRPGPGAFEAASEPAAVALRPSLAGESVFRLGSAFAPSPPGRPRQPASGPSQGP